MNRHLELNIGHNWQYYNMIHHSQSLWPVYWPLFPILHIGNKNVIESFEFSPYYQMGNKCNNYFDELMKSIGNNDINSSNAVDHKLVYNYQIHNDSLKKKLLENVLKCSKKMDDSKLYKNKANYQVNYSIVICCDDFKK
jgi:hypothetical protein